jgi:hypothetical protein
MKDNLLELSVTTKMKNVLNLNNSPVSDTEETIRKEGTFQVSML